MTTAIMMMVVMMVMMIMIQCFCGARTLKSKSVMTLMKLVQHPQVTHAVFSFSEVNPGSRLPLNSEINEYVGYQSRKGANFY